MIAGSSRATASAALAALSALHILWATGSAWPASDRARLADAVGGFKKFPSAAACLGVATLLGCSSAIVGGFSGLPPRLSRLGCLVTSFVLLLRGTLGLAGAMPHHKRSRTFAKLDRRCYSPMCLSIGTLALVAAADD